MALARIKTWGNEVLTANDLNAEFNNILNNALALVSPWTGNMNADGNSLIGLGLGSVGSPSLQFTSDTNTGIYSSGAEIVDIAAGGVRTASFVTVASGVNYFKLIPGATANAIKFDAEGTDVNIPIAYRTKGTGNHIFSYNAGSNEMGRFSDGILLWGTTLVTGANAGDVIAKNAGRFGFVNNAGTSSANFGMLSSADSLVYRVPLDSSAYSFQWGTTELLKFVDHSAGGGILFTGESGADHDAPSANNCVIYTRDNGAGKTQFVARFATGAVQVLATEP